MILPRDCHKADVENFLCKKFSTESWEFTLPPHGTGQESYFAKSATRSCFIKLGVQVERYEIMCSLGLSPKIILSGSLEDGTTILVQEKIDGRMPSRKEFQQHSDKFAECLRKIHQNASLKQILPSKAYDGYRDAGLEALEQVEQRWQIYRSQVPICAAFVDDSVGYLREQINQFRGSGLVVSHNDPCNGNWLISTTGRVYLIDYESMSLDDPALDLGAILWWYYPPEMRKEFLEIAGYSGESNFRERMRIRMAIHCLNIILPRENSFDRFDVHCFDEALADFRAILDGKENPQGYIK